MTFLYTLQIMPLSNNTTFSLCSHFQCTCPALLAFHCCVTRAHSGSTVYSGFTVLPLYFDYIFLQHIWEKVLLLRRFIHCKHSKNTTLFFVLISIAHLAFSELQWMYSLQCFTVLPLHFHRIFSVCICSALLEKSSSSS